VPHPAKKKTIKGKKQDISIQTYSCQNCLKPILESSSLFKDNQKSKECIHCYVKRMQDERQKASHLAVRLDVVFQCQDAINSAKIKNLESKQKEQEKINKHLILKVNKIDKKTSVNQTLTNRLISKIYNPTEKDIEKLDSKIKARRLAKDRDDIEEASEKTIYQPF